MKTIFKVISILFVVTLSLFIFGCAESTKPNDKFAVTFKDYDGTILRQEIIQLGHSATAPKDPERYGYIFLGWDSEYTNIQKDTILIAQYERDENVIFEYKVIFTDWDGTILKEEIVQEGSNATAPLNPEREGYEFVGWNNEYFNVKEDLIVKALYEEIIVLAKYKVTFVTNCETIIEDQVIEEGQKVIEPQNLVKPGYIFEGWYFENEKWDFDTFVYNDNIILEAKWKKEITVYEENGYKYINLGKYPQTVVTDESIVNALSNIDNTNELGYIEYNGNEYKKMVANNWLYLNFVNGNKIVDGKIYYFLVEPIKWRILEENNGTYKLLCELIIDNRDFYHKVNERDRIINGQTIYPNNYEYSDIRAWLNGYDGSSYNVDNYNGIGFYDIVFTNAEKEIINNTLVDNSLVSTNESSNNLLCNDTNDKIYLLSKKDVLNETYGFSSTTSADETRKAVVSDYARSKYGSGLWWLRSPKNEYINVARVVARDGDADYPDGLVSDTYYGVRPALTITI